MSIDLKNLSERYIGALGVYLDQTMRTNEPVEANLEQAYELGRAAISEGAGILDIARQHQEALFKVLPTSFGFQAEARLVRLAETFLMEVLSPFEAAHRGFRDACTQLRELNATLERRNEDLLRINEEIKTREHQLAEAQQLAHLGSWEWDVGANEVRWSDELYRIFGRRPGAYEATFDSYLECVHPGDRRRVRGIVLRALRQRKPFVSCERVIRPDGEIRILHSQGDVISGEDGSVARMVGFCQDITERRRAEEALEESETKFRSVVESARDGIVSADGQGRMIFVNRRAEALFGHPKVELLGRRVTCLIPDEYHAMLEDGLKRSREGGRRRLIGRTVELHGVRRDGRRFPIELSVSSWKSHGGIFFTGIVRDITERRRAEAALRESREHYYQLFQEARRMEKSLRHLSNRILYAQEEERTRISRELHDEVGQALTAINIDLTRIQQETGRDPSVCRKLAETRALLEKSMECVHRFARELRPAVLDDLGLLPALRSCVNGFSKRTGIRVRFQADGVSETLDPERKTVIYRIAQECLNNVAKHARASGVEVRLSNSGGVVRMLIQDDGRGFSAGSGSGPRGRKRLGLLGMRERVNLVSGRFDIESAPGAGTTVRIEIPVKSFPKEPNAPGCETGRGRRARSNQKLKTTIES